MAGRNSTTVPESHSPRLAGIVQITVIEGSTSQVFYVARALLDSEAPGFMSTVDPTGHAQRTTVELTDVQIEIFDYFVKCLENGFHTDVPRLLYFRSNWSFWIRSYVFREKYGIPIRCDSVLGRIWEKARRIKEVQSHGYITVNVWTPPDLVIYVYDNTPFWSPIRVVLVDIFCMFTSPLSLLSPLPSLSHALKLYPKDFLVDVMIQTLGAPTGDQLCAQVAGSNKGQQDNEGGPGDKRKRIE